MPSDAPESGPLLERVLRETAEQTAFLFLESSGQDSDEGAERLYATITLTPTGQQETLVLSMPKGLATEVAATMMGLEPDAPDAKTSAPNAVAELLNLIAGSWAASRFGSSTPCGIGIPSSGVGSGPSGAGVTLYADGLHPVALSVAA